MRILLIALCTVLISAKNTNINKKDKKIKRPGKLLGANDVSGSNTCYVNCGSGDVCGADAGCVVFDGADTTLGTFSCQCESCADGETGRGSFECTVAGIRDLEADDTSASCGGDGFDIGLMLGRDDCEVSGSTVSCPGTCQCESCGCDPCSEDKECVEKNGRFGGFVCNSKVN
mmetsp:Transcript_3007/g.6558  ORF Transcript_3007/g.6558 Transcript_3007/m.6558 type:complete len:173 (+) Transcript_3007:146-664(+)